MVAESDKGDKPRHPPFLESVCLTEETTRAECMPDASGAEGVCLLSSGEKSHNPG